MTGRKSSARGGRQRGVDFGATRIGVHAGPVLVGNFGGGRFFDYTAYGDTMNIAARLEAANKHLGSRICVSEAVARNAPTSRDAPLASSPCAAAASRFSRLSR